MTTDPAYYLSIYIHAHKTGNSVPPHIEAEAEAALKPQAHQKETMSAFLATKEAIEGYLRDTTACAEAPVLTDEQILALSQYHMVSYTMSDGKVVHPLQDGSDMRDSVLSFARDLIARCGRPAITPIPVSERPWEQEGFCDANGCCWWFHRETFGRNACWCYSRGSGVEAFCLPHWALPISAAPETV